MPYEQINHKINYLFRTTENQKDQIERLSGKNKVRNYNLDSSIQKALRAESVWFPYAVPATNAWYNGLEQGLGF